MNAYVTTYWWSVNCSDEHRHWTTETYRSTTKPENLRPAITNPIPANGATDVYVNPTLSIDASDLDGNTMNITFKTNATGTWETIGSNISVGDGTYTQQPDNMNLVKHTYSQILAPLRNQRFYSLEEINDSISKQLKIYNQRLFQKKEISREELFISQEKALLKPLPESSYEIKKIRELTVQKNVHIVLTEDKHYYSVPYVYVGQKVKVIYTSRIVNIYCRGNQIACHVRNRKRHGYTTLEEHLPSHHRYWLDRNPDYYLSWAKKISVEVEEVIKKIFESKPHPEQAYKSCEGIKSLGRKAGEKTLIKACRIALEFDQCHYSFLSRIIKNGIADQVNDEQAEDLIPLPAHNNLRGKKYYQLLLNL